jgi:membrane associated rhomboid family serine protease
MLIVPLKREDQSGIPVLTLLVCLACVSVYLFTQNEADKLSLAYYPHSANVLRMFTSVFAHADILHLLGNLFFFYCFSRAIEAEVSPGAYLTAFLVFVLATNLTYSASVHEPIPTIGLSGVVWGFMGMFLVNYPKDNINCFVWYLWVFKTIEVPAFIFILAFLALDIGAFRNEPNNNVNHVAHISGFIAGVIFMFCARYLGRSPPPPTRASPKPRLVR